MPHPLVAHTFTAATPLQGLINPGLDESWGEKKRKRWAGLPGWVPKSPAALFVLVRRL